ncbi:MAG: FUSC family protein [Hyphomicrobiaceae bacterium]|nr:FUSC family protein [Hyphomicrobiaceae bacterium]
MLSDRTRSAFIIAGGITLAYGIALWMNWERPYWAGLAVAMIGLSTMGESIFKALQRLTGTAVAILVALALIALFAQERWLFTLFTCVWVCFCIWRMQNDPEIYYFWYCCGFIVPLLSIMSGFDSARSFYIVELRARETLLGVLCFTVLALLLSHRSTYGKLRDVIDKQISLLRDRINVVRRHAHHDKPETAHHQMPSGSDELQEQIARNFMNIPTLLTSAQMESFELRQHDDAWHEISRRLQTISANVDRLDLSFELGNAGIGSSDLDRLDRTLVELSKRLENTSHILCRQAEPRRPQTLNPSDTPQETTASANPFHQGEQLLRHEIYQDLDHDTQRLNAAAADAVDKGPAVSRQRANRAWILIPDPEHMAIVAFQFCAIWLAFFTYIYVPALPDGPVVLVLTVILAINLGRMPWVTATKLALPAVVASVYGAIAHIFIMPHLSGFLQLGTMIFTAIFIVAWLFHTEELQVGRFLGIALFMLIIQVSNENQTYSAVYAMNVVAALLIILLLLTLLQRVPISFRPEHVIRRMIRRFANSLVSVLGSMKWDRHSANTWWARQLRAYHMNQLRTLPARIDTWIDKLPAAAASSDDLKALKHLTNNLHAVAYRTADLVEMRKRDADEIWVERLRDEVIGWRIGIEKVVQELLDQSHLSNIAAVETQLDQKLKTIEKIITDAASTEGAPNEQEAEGTAHMQRVLSAYRGISMAVLGVARNASHVGWQRLSETRF